MLMQKKALRGEEVKTVDGQAFKFLEYQKNGFALVLNEYGKILSIAKNRLDLPLINTSEYEKVNDLPQVQESAHGG